MVFRNRLRFLFMTTLFALSLAGCRGPRHEQTTDWDTFLRDMETERAVQEARARRSAEADVPVAELPPQPEGPTVARAGRVTIQPESVIQVSVREDPGLDGSYRVSDIYSVDLGYVGPVFIRNSTEEEAAAKIKEVLENRFFTTATVSVRILRASYDRVAVRGEVNRPGTINIGSGDRISLNEALLRSGQVTTGLRETRLRVVRGGMTSAVAGSLDGETYQLVDEEGLPHVPRVHLWNNDVVYVYSAREASVEAERPTHILVLGEVNRRGIYRFEPAAPATMLHLILRMDGFPDFADTSAIRVIRRGPEGRSYEFTVDAREILREGDPDKDVPLENGDRVIVPARRFGLFR